MDIRPNRPAVAADLKTTTTQTQKSQSDSSLLYRMAVRTMLEDLETVKKKLEPVIPPVPKTAPSATVIPMSAIIPVPLPPAYLVSSVKTVPLSSPPAVSPVKAVILPPVPPTPPVKTEPTKIVTLENLLLEETPTEIAKPVKETKDELTKTIDEIMAGKVPEKIAEETAIKKEGAVLKIKDEQQKTKEEEQKDREEKALKIKEEKQKAKEEQKIAQQATREEERKRREEEKMAKELAEKTAKELRLAEEMEKREAAKKFQEEINQNLEKAQIDYEAGDYENVIELAQKILANESISWFLKLKVGRLIKEATSGLRKKQISQIKEATRIKDEENLKKIIVSLPSSAPLITAQRTTASPPPNLPTLPDSSENIEDLIAQALPQENFKEAPAPTPKTISPLLTELISEIPSESEAEESGFNFLNLLKNRRVLFIGASLALVIILVGFGWWFANKEPASSPIVISPSNTPIISASPTPSRRAPTPLFATDKQKTITLESGGRTLKESLLALAKTEELIGTFTALNIKDSEGKFLSLKEIAQNLNLEIFSMPTQDCSLSEEDCLGSKTLEDLIDLTKFSLFAYSQNGSSTNSSSPFAAAGEEKEGRLGLIISLKKQTSSTSAQLIASQLSNSLKDLETLLPKEFASFLLKTPTLPQIPTFSQASYKNVIIRYLNLPTSELAIDYAIIDNKLVFATSKESMFVIIDRILSEAGSIETIPILTPTPTEEKSQILTPKESYQKMKAEADNIKSYTDFEPYILKYGSKEQIAKLEANQKQVNALPQSFKDQVLALAKGPSSSEITTIQETINGNVATLNVQTTKPGLKGVVTLVLENNQWKLELESWKQQ